MSAARLNVWPPLPPAAWLRRPRRRPPFPLGEPGCRLYAMGRHALFNGVRALGLAAGDEVLMPAYNHGSEVEALERAGLALRFYPGTDSLEPDESELERMRGERTRALFLIHYLGFPQEASRWRRYCDERGLLLLEDAAQAWLAGQDGRPVGSDGDLAIFCLYKTFGMPDGAALRVRGEAAEPVRRDRGVIGALKRNTAWVASRGVPVPVPARVRGGTAREFDLGDPASAPSTASSFLLPRVADPEAAERRRANYVALLEELGDLVPPPFRELPTGASPFAFPIAVDRKPEVLARLADNGIRALDFWSMVHPSIPEDLRTGSRRARMIGLPVHQELRPGDLGHIAQAVRR